MSDSNSSAAIEQNGLLCAVTVESRTARSVFQTIRYTCDAKVKYKVSYYDFVKGERKTEYVCGVHKKKLESWAERLKKRVGCDAKMVVEQYNGA